MADKLTAFMCLLVRNSGSLNHLEAKGLITPITGWLHRLLASSVVDSAESVQRFFQLGLQIITFIDALSMPLIDTSAHVSWMS